MKCLHVVASDDLTGLTTEFKIGENYNFILIFKAGKEFVSSMALCTVLTHLCV